MRVTARNYDHAADYERVSRFLVRTYGITSGHVNWLQPRWEYMHYHPLIRGIDLGSIGVWEARGDVVGVVHPEHEMGTAYFEIDPGHDALKGEMLRHAEGHLATSRDGVRRCGEMGASVACVGTTFPFYRSLGFQLVYRSSAWHREWA